MASRRPCRARKRAWEQGREQGREEGRDMGREEGRASRSAWGRAGKGNRARKETRMRLGPISCYTPASEKR